MCRDKFSSKKIRKKKFSQKKKFVKKICRKKKFEKNLKNNFGNFFIFEKKSVEIRLILEKKIEKILKIIFALCLFLKTKVGQKSVHSPIKG